MPASLLHSDRLSRDFISVGVEDTVSQALEKIRSSPETGEIFYCYACDKDGRLVGVVPVRKLLRAPQASLIRELMFTRVVRLPLDAPDELVEDFFVTYRLLAIPVVDAEGRIAGVVEVNSFVDAFSDVLSEDVEGRVRQDVFALVGLPSDELKRRKVWRMAFSRFPWLLFNVAGGFLAATISKLFEAELERLVVAAAFIPLVLVLAESLGMQTMAISVSMLSEGKFDVPTARREVMAAALAGGMGAVVVGLLGRVYYPGLAFPAVLLASIAVATLSAATLGALLPWLFRSFKVDPKLAAAPLVLAISDNLSLLIYFSLIRSLVH